MSDLNIWNDKDMQLKLLYIDNAYMEPYLKTLCEVNDIKEYMVVSSIMTQYFGGFVNFIEEVIANKCDAFERVQYQHDIPYRMQILMNRIGGNVYTIDEYYFLFNRNDDNPSMYTLSVRQQLFTTYFYNDLGEYILELLGESAETLDYIEYIFTLCERLFTEFVYNWIIGHITETDTPLRRLYTVRPVDNVLLLGCL